MKVKIEWKDGNAWKQAQADLLHTRNSNCVAKYDGSILVFQSLKEGEKVLSQVNGKWARVGRITRNNVIFLGEGLAYSEQCEQAFKGANPREMLTVKW